MSKLLKNFLIAKDALEASLKIVFASQNEHKIGEINQIAKTFGSTVEFTAPSKNFDPIENGKTFIENAEIKALDAMHVEKEGRKFFLADDSGLCIDALDGEPGLKSARYAPTNDERIQKVLKNLDGTQTRKAHFVCAMVLCNEKGEVLYTTEGFCHGEIALKAQGKGGFGYDPIFTPVGFDCTIAQIKDEEKNEISHRGKALREVLEWIARAI